MNILTWASLAGLLVLQLAVSVLAWRHLARKSRVVVAAWQRAASGDVPTSMLVIGMSRIEARLQQLENASMHTPPAQAGTAGAYQLAQRMAQNGADAAQIAEACGIARHEAQLLARLHHPAPPCEAAA
jgi:hypothetical protein